jgi:segregation and condensation protein B
MSDTIDLRDQTDPGQPVQRSEEASDSEVPELGAPDLAAGLEALLLLADEPQTALTLAEITGTPEPQVVAQLRDLAAQYLADGRGFELREVDAGWRFYTARSCRDLVTRFVTDGRQSRLSQAALETLAIVAYRQPVTRSQVGAVRGVNADGVIKTLHSRGLVAELPADDAAGSARFVTTGYFLDRMGLASLSELPPIADHLPDFSALDELID